MARFFGKVGFGSSVEQAPGVWVDEITELSYYGDVVRDTRRLSEAEKLNKNISTSNSISIVADAHANENYFAIRFVEWGGVTWTVTEVEVQFPRLILRLGEVYNGPRAAAGTP
jgi:hypothetical protein